MGVGAVVPGVFFTFVAAILLLFVRMIRILSSSAASSLSAGLVIFADMGPYIFPRH